VRPYPPLPEFTDDQACANLLGHYMLTPKGPSRIKNGYMRLGRNAERSEGAPSKSKRAVIVHLNSMATSKLSLVTAYAVFRARHQSATGSMLFANSGGADTTPGACFGKDAIPPALHLVKNTKVDNGSQRRARQPNELSLP
jgi:hypothetical protein